MLQIELPEVELFDEKTQEFRTIKSKVVQLEHSLISISKWEARWGKPFLSNQPKTFEESVDYIRCMTLTQNMKPIDYSAVNVAVINQVNSYIESPMTATTISRRGGGPVNRDIVTSELIYYWMIVYGIPFECQKWHLNRLMTLIQICNIKEGPQQKMSKRDIFSQNRSLNAARRQRMGSRG